MDNRDAASGITPSGARHEPPRHAPPLRRRLAAPGGLHPPLASRTNPKATPDEMIHKYLAAEVERLSKNVHGRGEDEGRVGDEAAAS